MGTKLQRKLAKVFAENANGSYVTAFKTTGDETPTYSKDVEVIQNSEYENGWINGLGNDEVYGEDLNGVNYTQSYLTKYLYQQGIPEWKVDEEYFENSYCQVNGDLYKSLSDNNIGNNPTIDNVNWVFVDITAVTASNIGTGDGVFKQKTGGDLEFKGFSVTGNGSLTATDDTLVINIGGGETGTVYWENLPKNASTPTKIGQELATKQDSLGYTAENTANKVTEIRADTVATNTAYPTELATRTAIDTAISGISFSLNGFDNNVGELSGQSYATIEPNGDYTNTHIGTSTHPITSVNASNVNASTVNSGALFNLNGDISIRCQDGDSIEIGTDGSGSSKRLEVSTSGVTVNGDLSITGTASTDKIQGKTTATSVETGASIVPDTDNTYDLGSSSSKYFANAYVKKTYTNTIDDAGAGNVTIDAETNIGGHLNVSNTIKMQKGQIFSWQDGGSAVAQFYTSGSGELVLNSNNQSLTTNCKINSGYGGQIQIASAIIKDTNGNTVHIYPETRTDRILIGNTGSSGNEYNGLIRIYNNDADIRIGAEDYGGSAIKGLHVQGRLMPLADNTYRFGGAGARWSEAHATNFYGTYNPPSDRNKKDNIVERGTRKSGGSSLQAINDLKTYSYTFKDDAEKKTHIGIMAQELREVEPLLVSNKAEEGSKEEDLCYDLGGYCTLLTEAIKELSAKVETLEARIEVLEKEKEVAEK